MDASPLTVAIVGGGIGGLAAAITLQALGARCTVFERDEAFMHRREGFGLTLTNNPKGPLAELGILDSCIDRDCPSSCHWVFKPTGEIMGYYGRFFKDKVSNPAEQFPGRSAGPDDLSETASLRIRTRGNLRIPRQDLRQMLLDKLQPGSIRWNMRLHTLVDDPTEDHVLLKFTNGGVERAHLVVGADGINSVVRQHRDTAVLSSASSCSPGGRSCALRADKLNYLGVAVIIGISTAKHSLLDHRGFYVIDGTHRLFTMPFRSPLIDLADSGELQTMWQLSFSGLSEEEALALRYYRPQDLIAEAMRRTSSWFCPVGELIRESLTEDIWATPLYDRDDPVLDPRNKECPCRVTVLGDSCHPMSMFKGQGANQALQDATLLAKWMAGLNGTRQTAETTHVGQKRRRGLNDSISSLCTRIRCFEREMVDRAAPKVSASRVAASLYHSPEALMTTYGIEGLRRSCQEDVDPLSVLAMKGVGANALRRVDAEDGPKVDLESLVWSTLNDAVILL